MPETDGLCHDRLASAGRIYHTDIADADAWSFRFDGQTDHLCHLAVVTNRINPANALNISRCIQNYVHSTASSCSEAYICGNACLISESCESILASRLPKAVL